MPNRKLVRISLPSSLPTGMKVEDLIGWRIWRVRGRYLQSYSQPNIWVPGEPMTGTPGDRDTVGVWSFKKRSDAINKMLESTKSFPSSYWAYGSVRLWGEVIGHKDGYRAENARILTIDDATTNLSNLIKLQRQYGVPVLTPIGLHIGKHVTISLNPTWRTAVAVFCVLYWIIWCLLVYNYFGLREVMRTGVVLWTNYSACSKDHVEMGIQIDGDVARVCWPRIGQKIKIGDPMIVTLTQSRLTRTINVISATKQGAQE